MYLPAFWCSWNIHISTRSYYAVPSYCYQKTPATISYKKLFMIITGVRENITPHFWQNPLTFCSISDTYISFCWRVEWTLVRKCSLTSRESFDLRWDVAVRHKKHQNTPSRVDPFGCRPVFFTRASARVGRKSIMPNYKVISISIKSMMALTCLAPLLTRRCLLNCTTGRGRLWLGSSSISTPSKYVPIPIQSP